jgi:hypothetical protein
MNYLDTVAMSWGQQFKRNPYPDTLIWQQDDVIHDRSYWLEVNPKSATSASRVIAKRVGQVITIQESTYDSLTILLNDSMLNLDQKVEVYSNNALIYSGIPERKVSTIWESFKKRADTTSLYTAKLVLDLKNPSNNNSSTTPSINHQAISKDFGYTQKDNQIILSGLLPQEFEVQILNSLGQIYYKQRFKPQEHFNPVIHLDPNWSMQNLWMQITPKSGVQFQFKVK